MTSEARKLDSDLQRPDVFGYQNYKTFLRDHIHYLKLTDSEFSIRNLAVKAEVSIGYISTILHTEQEISNKAFNKVIVHLGLSDSEVSYLRLLTVISREADGDVRIDAIRKLQKFKNYSRLNPDEVLVTNYFSNWYYVAIREMTHLPDFQLNANWVHEKLNFSVPLADVAKALEFLVQNKLIRFKPDGSFEASDHRLRCEGDIYRFILTHFHRQMFELASQSIDNTNRAQRNVTGHTVTMSQSQYDEAKKIMDKALDAIAELPGENDSAEKATYHFMFLGFPLSKPGIGRK